MLHDTTSHSPADPLEFGEDALIQAIRFAASAGIAVVIWQATEQDPNACDGMPLRWDDHTIHLYESTHHWKPGSMAQGLLDALNAIASERFGEQIQATLTAGEVGEFDAPASEVLVRDAFAGIAELRAERWRAAGFAVSEAALDAATALAVGRYLLRLACEAHAPDLTDGFPTPVDLLVRWAVRDAYRRRGPMTIVLD